MTDTLVTGATGFIGSWVCRALVEAGYRPLGLTRKMPPAREVADVLYVTGDVTEPGGLRAEMLGGCRFVVHLVGIIAEDKRRGQTFERVHVDGTRAVVEAARATRSVERLVYVSAQGADLGSASSYSRTKAQAEEIVRASGLPFTILRPSLVLGPGGDFVGQMEGLLRRPPLSPVPLPFVPVPGNGQNRFQPVWVGDLAAAIVGALSSEAAAGRTIPVGGRDALTFDELLRGFGRRLNVRKPHLHVPLGIMGAAASVLEAVLPTPPVTRDQLVNLRVDNVTDNAALRSVLGVEPLGFEETLNRVYAERGA